METRDHILHTAIALFARHGYENVPLMEIAFDAGMNEDRLRSYFPTKEAIYDEIFARLPEWVPHYDPTLGDLQELIDMGESTRDILARFVSYYNMEQEPLFRQVYRLSFMEQHKNPQVGRKVFADIVRHPRDNAARFMDMMAEKGLIPSGDHMALADVWNRTSLMFERLVTDNVLYFSMEEYLEQTEFFISLAQRGVTPVDVTGLVPHTTVKGEYPLEGERLQVVTKAVDLFDRDGYTAVSMPQIAVELGMPVPRLFVLYDNKSDILFEALAMIRELREHKTGVFSAALEMEPRDAVMHLADAYSALRDELTLKVYRVVFKEQYSSEDLGDIMAGSILREIEAVTQTLDRLAQQGKIEPCESRKIATAFVFTMCLYDTGDTVFAGENYDNRHERRLQAIALILGLIKKIE